MCQNPPMQTLTFATGCKAEICVLKFSGYSFFPSHVIDDGSRYHHPNISVLFSAGGQRQAGGDQADRDWWIPAQWAHSVYHASRAASSAWGGGISTVLQVKSDISSQVQEYTFSVVFSVKVHVWKYFYALIRSSCSWVSHLIRLCKDVLLCCVISPHDIFHETNCKTQNSKLTAGRTLEDELDYYF